VHLLVVVEFVIEFLNARNV